MELILSVLQAQPSARDSKLYLQSFAPTNSPPSINNDSLNPGFPTTEAMPTTATLATSTSLSSVQPSQPKRRPIIPSRNTIAQSILSTPSQHTGLVKIQGPFTDRQLASIVDGFIYLKTLGLMPIIVLDDEAWHHPFHTNLTAILSHGSKPHGTLHLINPSETRHQAITRELARLSEMMEARGSRTRPFYDGILRLSDERNPDGDGLDLYIDNLDGLKSAIIRQEIPIIPPVVINSSCAAICVSADQVIKSLAKGLAATSAKKSTRARGNQSIDLKPPSSFPTSHSIPVKADHHHQDVTNDLLGEENKDDELDKVDLQPLRLMIINREGGIPSPARNGHPHLSINLASEYDFIKETFRWTDSHPTSLANLSMAKACLKYLPNESSAVIVSHRSPKSLIANLITNKPAHSPSLNHSILLHHTRDRGGLATPTLIRKGLPIKVIRGIENVDLVKIKDLLEKSFKKQLDYRRFFERLESSLRFVIVAGDYQGAAIVTDEGEGEDQTKSQESEPIVYLDKFAVLPSLQGEGIVDFLWGALRDETFGLGNLDALNNNGGLCGLGEPVDLVWRSRTNNPVNRWYFERSNGFIKLPSPTITPFNEPLKSADPLHPRFSLFWCIADRFGNPRFSDDRCGLVDPSSSPSDPFSTFMPSGKLERWCRVINQIPSCWIP